MQGMRLATGVLCVCLAMVAVADAPLRVFLTGPASNALTEFRHQLVRESSSVLIVDQPADADVLMPVGDAAFMAAPADTPVLGLQVSRKQLDDRRVRGCICSGIYAGARPADQLALLETLLPRARRVGVIARNGNDSPVGELVAEANGRIEIRAERVSSADELPAALARILPAVDVLLLLPDPDLFNADTARLLLLTSYRQGRPVIGPDSAFVRAGSLASVDASTEDLVGQTVKMLESYARGDVPAPRHAARTITVNPHVARTYGISSVDSQVLENTLWGQP